MKLAYPLSGNPFCKARVARQTGQNGGLILMRKVPRHEAVDPDIVRCPFHGERLDQVHDAGLGRSRRRGSGAARPAIGRADVQDRAAAAARDTAAGEFGGAEEGAVERDLGDRPPAIGRKLFRRPWEVRGSAIGRAAWRERVGRDVWIWVGAGSFKKK